MSFLHSDLAQPPAPSASESAPLSLLGFSSHESLSLRALVGTLRGSGGFVHSTRYEPEGASEIDFEFPGHATLDLYSLLVALGLELDCASHLQLTGLCQCARDRSASTPARTHAFTLRVIPHVPVADDERFSWIWRRLHRRPSSCQA